ncbi:MAG: aminotransferase class V-fold PLP-dependent enzyme [Clostridia bacterium]|nr:aminotransferase class V-fold PLP-dependent enzyme [Clostridia bacterium]MCL6521109.1 aminotransferase class V-fold PLP-dependent enzyme [Bacillota bacterium]
MWDLEAVRRELPAVQRYVYLNTGTAGPLPRRAAAALEEALARELEEGRAWPDLWPEAERRRELLRQRVASLIGARPDEVALTHHTSEGLNIVLWGIDWRPGDEVVTTDAEHEGGLVPLYLLHRRRGVGLRFAHLGDGSEEAALEAVRRALTPSTRLLLLSHVSYSTGARLPLAEMAALARERGVQVLVDGAQSVGALPVDVAALGVDYYALPGQKWLLGPEGTGALYVRADRLEELQPTFAAWASARHGSVDPRAPGFEPAPGARRFEVGTVFDPGLEAWRASLEWLDSLGWPAVFERVGRLARYARERLGGLPGLRVTTPGNAAGLLHFRLEGREPAGVVAELRRSGFMLRATPHPEQLRISTAFFNTEEEIDRLARALEELPPSA